AGLPVPRFVVDVDLHLVVAGQAVVHQGGGGTGLDVVGVGAVDGEVVHRRDPGVLHGPGDGDETALGVAQRVAGRQVARDDPALVGAVEPVSRGGGQLGRRATAPGAHQGQLDQALVAATDDGGGDLLRLAEPGLGVRGLDRVARLHL